jgi:hypothetical protein
MNLTTFLTLAHRFGPPTRADHSDKLRLWVLSELVEKGQGYQRSQRVQDRAILRLSRGPEVLVTPVRSYSKIALFLTTSNQNKDMSRGRWLLLLLLITTVCGCGGTHLSENPRIKRL